MRGAVVVAAVRAGDRAEAPAHVAAAAHQLTLAAGSDHRELGLRGADRADAARPAIEADALLQHFGGALQVRAAPPSRALRRASRCPWPAAARTTRASRRAASGCGRPHAARRRSAASITSWRRSTSVTCRTSSRTSFQSKAICENSSSGWPLDEPRVQRFGRRLDPRRGEAALHAAHRFDQVDLQRSPPAPAPAAVRRGPSVRATSRGSSARSARRWWSGHGRIILRSALSHRRPAGLS